MERKRLLEKFGIPLNHLDFAYVSSCTDGREMEKILQILRSGEEGYYPDLTRCAENKLRELRPNSRLFRFEEHVRSRDALSPNEWKPIYEWTHDIKTKDSKLAAAADESNELLQLSAPPIRKGGTIKQSKELAADNGAKPQASCSSGGNATKSQERIKSTDYHKWDKYDADEEILRMDLAEERVQEEVERKNRLNLQKSTLPPKICEMDTNNSHEEQLLQQLTDVEREHLAEEYRLRGNEYFRAREYDNALKEYDRAIRFSPATAATAYNNRAATNMKLQKYAEAIEDGQCCLKLEPNNIKARLRLAQATQSYGRRRESYLLYEKVLELDAQNAIALKAMTELRTQLGDLPPSNATRLQIQEETPSTSKKVKSSKAIGGAPKQTSATAAVEKCKPNPKAKPKDYDLANLVIPNRVVKNKWANAAHALNNMRSNNLLQQQQQQNVKPATAMSTVAAEPELNLSVNTGKSLAKTLIEEI